MYWFFGTDIEQLLTGFFVHSHPGSRINCQINIFWTYISPENNTICPSYWHVEQVRGKDRTRASRNLPPALQKDILLGSFRWLLNFPSLLKNLYLPIPAAVLNNPRYAWELPPLRGRAFILALIAPFSPCICNRVFARSKGYVAVIRENETFMPNTWRTVRTSSHLPNSATKALAVDRTYLTAIRSFPVAKLWFFGLEIPIILVRTWYMMLQ